MDTNPQVTITFDQLFLAVHLLMTNINNSEIVEVDEIDHEAMALALWVMVGGEAYVTVGEEE